MTFFSKVEGTYRTSAANIIKAANFFKQHPDGLIKTGIWTNDSWTKEDFKGWFIRCLLLKCGGGEYTERELELIRDGRRVNDYFGKRIRCTGSMNFLSSPELQKRYPQVNNQSCLIN